MLLNALSAMGILIKKEDRYSNSYSSKSFLVRDAPGYIGYIALHHHYLMEAMDRT